MRGIIVADSDVVFATEEEAKAAAADLRQLIEYAGLEEVVETSPESSRKLLASLLWDVPPLLPLYDSDRRRLLFRMGVAACLLLAVLLGVRWIYNDYQAREQARLAAQQAIARDAQRKDQLAHPERYFRKAWLDAPLPLDAGIQCASAILSLPFSSNAWTLEQAVCAPSADLEVTWAHTKGASFVALPPGAHIASPQQAVETRTLQTLPARPADQPLLARDSATALLYQITQNISSQLSLPWEAPEQLRIDDKTTVIAPWSRAEFTFSNLPAQAMLGPDLFTALGLPGVMLTSLTLQNGTWTIKGYIYVVIS